MPIKSRIQKISVLSRRYLQSGINNRRKTGLLPQVPQTSAIPRIIHQTYHTPVLPPELQENVHKMLALNPGWEYRLYDDAAIVDFIKEHYGVQVLSAYERINPTYGAARADLFRYLLIYKIGGIYMDVKSSVISRLDGCLREDDTYLLGQWENGPGEKYETWGLQADLSNIPGGELQQWHIIAAPGHPFLRAVIETVLANIDAYNPGLHGVGKLGVLRVTGPIAYTMSVFPLLSMHHHRMVNIERDLGIIYSIYFDRNPFAHKQLFKLHYSKHTESVIKLGVRRKIIAGLILLMRRLSDE